jgi:hypothetical protein
MDVLDLTHNDDVVKLDLDNGLSEKERSIKKPGDLVSGIWDPNSFGIVVGVTNAISTIGSRELTVLWMIVPQKYEFPF